MQDTQESRECTIEQLHELVNKEEHRVCLFDVRLDSERESSKISLDQTKATITDIHIAVPRDKFQSEEYLYDYLTSVNISFPDEAYIIVYCRSGMRSLCVTNLLIEKMGFNENTVFSLQGGIEAWKMNIQYKD